MGVFGWLRGSMKVTWPPEAAADSPLPLAEGSLPEQAEPEGSLHLPQVPPLLHNTEIHKYVTSSCRAPPRLWRPEK